eukprot:TRINITY_DN67813_c6_g5_i1.p1 TRINITY_DN67813_c6_g5~~TRINITY_DN67813_c6_g5_i1.p1  ORF type:complete len:396 (-),score=55.53 TRINITY_DN67813_c6_g5_i1:61-1248(-)
MLKHITVLDASRVLAGPYIGMLLGDMGARVIKVERPKVGDDTRHWGPPFKNKESAYFFYANRNKQSITLNLKKKRGIEIFKELCNKSDILLENYKVGTMAKLGIPFDELQKTNPGLIHASITGFGLNGPLKDRTGYDALVQAQGGIMSINGPPGHDGTPYKVGVAITDISAGLHATIAVLGALEHRHITGRGKSIDVSLFDSQLSWLANVGSAYMLSGKEPQRYGNYHPTVVPYGTFPSSDGWFVLAIGNDSQFYTLCDVLGKPEWKTDEKFATNPARVQNRDLLTPTLEEIFKSKTKHDWETMLNDAGLSAAPVNTIPQALANPQVSARKMWQTVSHPVTGDIPQFGPVPKLNEDSPDIRLPPPLLGEHTAQVLKEVLQLPDTEIEQLRNDGVI